MDIKNYQLQAMKTAVYPEKYSIIYPTLGLVGEAGEVAEKVKKVIRDNNGDFNIERKEEIAKELGDILWYIANTANDLGYGLDTIAEMNISKLKSRQERNKLKGEGDNR